MAAILEYFEALERIKSGKPKIVQRGIKITNDAVAQEAGRAKGSIKKSREVFHELIAAIDEAASDQDKPHVDFKAKLLAAKSSTANYRDLYEKALGRELMLIEKIDALECELAKCRLPINQGERGILPFKSGPLPSKMSIERQN